MWEIPASTSSVAQRVAWSAAVVAFINGTKGEGTKGEGGKGAAPAGTAPTATTSAPGQPDLGYFMARVEPVLLGVCAQCHAGAGRGQLAIITHVGGTRFPLADHRKNYDTVVKLLMPGHPEQSKFLLKPLAERDGGVKHQGGDRITKGDANYVAWTEFINGTKGPPPPEDPPPEVELPTVSEKGLEFEAEAMQISGDAAVAPMDGARGGKDGKGSVVAPGPGGGRLTASFRTARGGDYALTLRMTGGTARGVRVRVDGGEPVDVDAPKEGFGEVSPLLPLDNGKPLDGRAGRLTIEGDAIKMDGRQGMARFLSPADLAHKKIEVKIAIPAGDDPARDDAWLLFDCLNQENGKFFGLADAGKKVVMGVIESNRPRVVKSIATPSGAPCEKLSVELIDGVAVGRLDGKPVLFVNFDRNLGAARFGFMTHGVATVSDLTAWHGAEEVHRMHPSMGGVFHLRRSNHSLEVELLSGGSALDVVTVKELSK